MQWAPHPHSNSSSTATRVNSWVYYSTSGLTVSEILLLSHLLIQPCLATTVVWTKSCGGLWSNPANWSPNQAPGAADDAVLAASGIYVVTLDINATVGSLTWAEATASTLSPTMARR